MSEKMSGPAAPTAAARAALRPLGHDEVRLDRRGWMGEWQQRSLTATTPHVLDRLESGEAYSNLARLVGDVDEPWKGMVFTDSDVYKALEAVAWAGSQLNPDDDSLARGRRFVDLLARVQEPDGYVNSHVQGVNTVERWSDPQWGHELYCAGHLIQAGVAAGRTGALPGLLDVACRFADLLVDTFGTGSSYVEGHPEVETSLVELYRLTGNERYLELARTQLDARGHGWLGEDRFGSAYFQDHVPVRAGAPAIGHAVRQLYLLAGAVDIAVETHDDELFDAARATWSDLFASKTYVTGAHGSRHRDEAIGDPYELPADRAYAETCAVIASFQLLWRSLLATGETRYADEMETVLYNAIAVSTSINGREFFYSNPLHLRTGHPGGQEDAPSERLDWYTCACCPPNIARLLASIQDYLVTSTDDGIQLHHFTDARLITDLHAGAVTIDVNTDYPYRGNVALRVESTVGRPWTLSIRVPAWCASVRLTLDGEEVPTELTSPESRVLTLTRDWDAAGTDVVVELRMPVRTIRPHPRIDAVRGCVAVARGPVLYAVEQAALPDGVVLEDVVFREITGVHEATDVGDIVAAHVDVEVDVINQSGEPLYGAVASDDGRQRRTVTLIPYHRWGNRGPGAMRVFLPTNS